MSRVRCPRRLLLTSLCAAIGGVGVFSSLDCTESDGPSPSPIPAGGFSLADSVYTIIEADTTVYVRVERSCGCDSAWVWAACSTGTASAGEDYLATTTKLGYPHGSVVESLAVPILSDTLSESPEIVLVTLGPASGTYAIQDPDTARIVILDDESPRPVFAFTQAHYGAFEGQGQAHVSVKCSDCEQVMGLLEVSARTADGTAHAGTAYVARTDRLVFNSVHTVVDFAIDLIDDAVPESGQTFTVQLFDPSSGGLVEPPETAAVEILDDDTPAEPQTLAMPLEPGAQWIYSATVSHRCPADDWTMHGTVVGTLDKRVRFQGEEYTHLSFASAVHEFASAQILLRQSGDSLLFVCPADTCAASPGSPPAQLQATLPWLLVDLSTVTDTTVTLFSWGSDHETGFDRRTLRVFEREDAVVPAGPFRQALRVRYEREFGYAGVTMGVSSWMEFTLGDSLGVIRADCGTYTYGQADPQRNSWEAGLVSCSLGP